MKFDCGCVLRNDGTFSDRCVMHAKESELEQEVWHLTAQLEWHQQELTAAKAECQRRGEMLNSCLWSLGIAKAHLQQANAVSNGLYEQEIEQIATLIHDIKSLSDD